MMLERGCDSLRCVYGARGATVNLLLGPCTVHSYVIIGNFVNVERTQSSLGFCFDCEFRSSLFIYARPPEITSLVSG